MSKKTKAPKVPKPPRNPKIPAVPTSSTARRSLPAPRAQALARQPQSALAPEGDDAVVALGPSPTESLAMWLEGLLARNIRIERLELRQRSIDGEATVHDWMSDDLHGQEPAAIAEDIYTEATNDVEFQRGVTTYVVYAFKVGASTHVSRHPFRLQPEDMNTGFDSEPGHLPEGHMAQAHRHAEVYARMMVSQASSTQRVLEAQNRELYAQATKGLHAQIQVAEMVQRLADKTFERSLHMRKVIRKEKMIGALFAHVMSFLPDVAMRFGIVPGGAQDVSMLMEMLSTFDQDKINMVAMAIPEEKHKDALLKFWRSAKGKAEAQRAAQAAEAKVAKASAATDAAAVAGAQAAVSGHVPIEDARLVEAQPAPAPSPPADGPVLSREDIRNTSRSLMDAALGGSDEAFAAILTAIPEEQRAGVIAARQKFQAAQAKSP